MVVEIELIQVMVVNCHLQCFNMAARLAVRSENQLELEKESLLAKALNLKPFAYSGDYTGKLTLSHTRRMSAHGR